MTFTDAAAEVLRLIGRPLHYKEITDIAIEKNLLSHVGKSPEVTMGARLAATLKKDTADNPLVRVKPGVFALREWDEKTIKSGLDGKKAKRGGKPEAAKARKDEEQPTLFEAAADDEAAEEGDSGAAAAEAGTETEAAEAGTETGAAGEGAQAATAVDDDEDDDEAVVGATAMNGVESAAAREHVPPPAPSSPRAASTYVDEEEGELEDAEPQGPDEAMRAEAVAGAAELFDEEDDDDQPILGGDDRATPGSSGEQGEGRRRRRRRRRGRGTAEATPSTGGLPSYVATPVFEARRENGREPPRSDRGEREGRPERFDRPERIDRPERTDRPERIDRPERVERADRPERTDSFGAEPVYRGPQVIELTGGEGHALDDLAGRDLADAVAGILSTFDRNAGAVSLRQIAETAQRRGRLVGDVQLVQSQVAAAVRADNARRTAAGQRTRFRFAGGRIALTDWLLPGDLARLEQEALAAVDRYRDAARRAFVRKLSELPGHAFVEICVLALERIGLGQLRAVRRAGAPGGESHFSGALRTAGDEIKLALVIRRDGREVGRERVTELRGSLHHYGPATAGWILTAGQMLSGAREEAAIPGTAPISLFDGLAVARVCEDNDVAVLRARLPIAIPDIDLLEALRAS
ncbi:HTH domain-containing protein [Sorangium sp. So ce1151]|uniref:HTH domain-containing protein n=1 Tax=Sorangium sp. So ce1151 TaxID=3133332 RepID=UPI003F62A6EF